MEKHLGDFIIIEFIPPIVHDSFFLERNLSLNLVIFPFFKFVIADFLFLFASKTAFSRTDFGVSKIHGILELQTSGTIIFLKSKSE